MSPFDSLILFCYCTGVRVKTALHDILSYIEGKIQSIIYTIICLKSVAVRKRQVAILARSPREMSQTDRIV